MRTTNIYLANLAVADVILPVIQLADYLGTYLYSPTCINFYVKPFTNRIICDIPTLLAYIFSFASVFFISLIALERYMAICYGRPAIHRQTNSRACCQTVTGFMDSFICYRGISQWELQYCIILPTALNAAIHFRTCSLNYRGFMSIIVIDVCQFLVACIGNITLYICIVRRLNKRKGRLASQERNHVAKMLEINACVFFICLVPFAVTNLIILFNLLFGLEVDTVALDMLNSIALITISLNSSVNPLI